MLKGMYIVLLPKLLCLQLVETSSNVFQLLRVPKSRKALSVSYKSQRMKCVNFVSATKQIDKCSIGRLFALKIVQMNLGVFIQIYIFNRIYSAMDPGYLYFCLKYFKLLQNSLDFFLGLIFRLFDSERMENRRK